jgi:tetratricopeptide (TPR) repeat protein
VILAVVVGAFCAVAIAVVVRPMLVAKQTDFSPSAMVDQSQPRALLRQLRDLDDDLASGKVADADHRRLRGVLERQAADALHIAPAADPRSRTGAARPSKARWVRRGVGLGMAAAVAVGVSMLLVSAAQERVPGSLATGEAAGGEAAGELAAVEAAVARVTEDPQQVSAHLDLARAYANADQPQLATVEYLAAIRLDPENAEANTALALVAFTSGSAEQAEALADKALETNPGYPEALYVRGLIRAMGLNHPDAAREDLEAYLDAAPFGSHRTTVESVLALVNGASK